MIENFYNYFNNCIIADKLPHAFLLETDDVEWEFENIITLLHNNKLIQNIEYINNINLFIVEPDGKEIKTELINSLQNKFMTKPSNDKYNIYIIKYVEKMNKSSANKILKFLEEPQSYILGILLASNSNVYITIKSRCQIFKINNSEKSSEYMEISKDIIYLLQNLNIENELILKKKLAILDRKDLINIFDNLIIEFNAMISNQSTNINNIISVSKTILILDNILRMLKSNVNIDLVLDKLCIEVSK